MDQVDLLAFGAHPDDVEFCAGGLLVKAKSDGLKTAIVDLTRGENSNFGSAAERDIEARHAAQILELDYRGNVGLPDCELADRPEYLSKVVEIIRSLRPKIIAAPNPNDIHPDHAAAGRLVTHAVFLSKIQKYSCAKQVGAHQVGLVLYYMLHTEFDPSFVLDVSDEHQRKMRSALAHTSQFYKPDPVSGGYSDEYHNPDFLEFVEARSRLYGYKVGVTYGEPYLVEGYLGLKTVNELLSGASRSLTTWPTDKPGESHG